MGAQKRGFVQSRGNDDAVDDHHVHVHDPGTAAAAAATATATAAVLPAVPAAAAAVPADAADAVRRAQGHAAGIRAGPETQAGVPET